MTDMPSFGILCCGNDIKNLAKSVKCCSIVSEIMKRAGFSLCGYHTVLTVASAESKKICGEKMFHLCKGCNVLITIGGDGFSPDDIVPDVTKKLCESEVAFFTSNLCGLHNIKNYDKGYKKINNKNFMPSRSCSGILRGNLVLNIRNDEDFILEIIPALLPAISFAVSGLSGKSANESKKLLDEFEMVFKNKNSAEVLFEKNTNKK